MAYSKVILNGTVLMDVTQDTVDAATLLSGETATKNSGAKVTGTYTPPTFSTQSKTVSPSTTSQTVQPDSGYDGLSSVTVNAISPTKAAQTYTPSTQNQTIASGQYLTGTQTILGDANLLAENIKKDVTIFGVTGTLEGGGNVPYDLVIKCNGSGFTTNVQDYEITKGSLADILSRKETNPLITGICHTLSKSYDDEDDVTSVMYLTAELVSIGDIYDGQEYPGYSASAELYFMNLNQGKRIIITCNDEEEIIRVNIMTS